jgi:hypothetical protein
MLLSASSYLQVDDRVRLGEANTTTNVAGLASPGVQVGSAVVAYSNVYGGGDVWLRSQARVEGFVRSAGAIKKQDATVRVFGQELAGVDVPVRIVSWSLEFPRSLTPLSTIGPNASLALGSRRRWDIKFLARLRRPRMQRATFPVVGGSAIGLSSAPATLS